MNKKIFVIFLLCSACSLGFAFLLAFQYIFISTSLLLIATMFALLVLCIQTGLSVYATTGKSLGLVWALREYAKPILFSTSAALLFGFFTFIFTFSITLNYVSTLLFVFSMLLMISYFIAQCLSIQKSFEK